MRSRGFIPFYFFSVLFFLVFSPAFPPPLPRFAFVSLRGDNYTVPSTSIDGMTIRMTAMPLLTDPKIALLCAVALLLAIALPNSALADPLFESTAKLPLTLTAPFEKIHAERNKGVEYPATVGYTDPAGGEVKLSAMVSVRGKFRLQKDICTNAQLWVNFKKGDLDGTLFDGQDKLKLVVQCRNVKRYAEYIHRERQAYEMFEVLSDLSFATRELEATYVDSDSGETRTQTAYFIQHHKRLAKEQDLKVYKEPIAPKEKLDSAQATIVSLYMYLLSNTDYSFIGSADSMAGEACCHNAKQLEGSDGALYPIPYDFDSAGFVNPPYALPSGDLGQTNINIRIYRGFCASDEVTNAAIKKLQDKRPALEAIALNKEVMSGKSVRRAKNYLRDFYKVIDDPKKLQKDILGKCR